MYSCHLSILDTGKFRESYLSRISFSFRRNKAFLTLSGLAHRIETSLFNKRHQFVDSLASCLYFVKVDTCCILICIKYN